jgi:hypothetical protein
VIVVFSLEDAVQLAIDPSVRVDGFNVEQCNVMVKKKMG